MPLAKKILVANRGEIARRVMRTARRMGLQTVAVYSEADAGARHVAEADEAVLLGGSAASESYLNIPALLSAIEQTGADLVHPGYGFLSENAAFVSALEKNAVQFAGPGTEAIEIMGDKITARSAAKKAGVNIIPGIGRAAENATEALEMAKQISFPVMLKAAAGGGGKGMRVVQRPEDIDDAFAMASSEAERSFSDKRMFVEKFIVEPRHIEVQLLADQHGNAVALGERECSLQRRHQKVIEEAPSVILREEVRQELLAQSVMLAKAVGYCSAGTVEFILDKDQNFYFLEMNTRLQVEHPVTEWVHGNIDLVECMIRIAAGEKLDDTLFNITPKGHAIEARLYAENPEAGFIPSAGRVHCYNPPQMGEYLRLDDAIIEGDTIPIHYDPMIGKLIAYGENRDQALRRLHDAVSQFQIRGVDNNLLFLEHLLCRSEVQSAQMHTKMLDDMYPLDGDFVTPENPETHAGLCALAMLSDTGYCQGVLHEADVRAGAELVVFVAKENVWQPFRFVITAGEHMGVQMSDGRRLELMDGDFASRLARFVIEDADQQHEGCVRFNRGIVIGEYQAEWQGQRLSGSVFPERLLAMQSQMPIRTAGSDEPYLSLAMSGVLLRLHVAKGDSVKIGQPLAVVEAMKMENLLLAPKSTKIVSIEAQEGDHLNSGFILMHFSD